MGMPRLFAAGMTLLLSCILHADAPPAVRIENAWARATPAGVTMGAAFMVITASTQDRLLAVSTSMADGVEIHSMTMAGGMMQMRQLTAVELPAGRRVSFEPTGMHLMLVGLKQPLAPNTAFKLQLRFERAAEQTVTVRVRPAGQ